MTKLDWRTLPAGRELDALVAERVFGCKTRSDYGVLWMLDHEGTKNEAWWVVPYYSTDIAAAWLVVAFMREQLFSARRAFTEALRDEVGKSLNLTSKIDHSGVVLNMQPVDVARAALAWAEAREEKR